MLCAFGLGQSYAIFQTYLTSAFVYRYLPNLFLPVLVLLTGQGVLE